MKKFDDILNEFRDSSGELNTNLHIMEDTVSVEEQMQYFEYAKRVRDDRTHVDRNYLISMLFTPEIDLERKRYCLSMLGGFTDVAAYRALETYHSSPLEPELKNWSALALVESRILLDSDLSGEKQYLIATGLGGIKDRLRFFSAFRSKNSEPFTDLQIEVIRREFDFQFEKDKVVVEDFQIKDNYVRMLLLHYVGKDLMPTIQNAIRECNQLGGFIDEKIMLTNVKQFSDEELVHLLKNKKSEQ